jgi:hypothetical protein
VSPADPQVGCLTERDSAALQSLARLRDSQAVGYSMSPADLLDCSVAGSVAAGPADRDGLQRCPEHPGPLCGSPAALVLELLAPVRAVASAVERPSLPQLEFVRRAPVESVGFG